MEDAKTFSIVSQMIEILQEITDWGEDKVSNHIYYVS